MAYIIGDVHGCINTLKALLKKIDTTEKIIFVGDLIDRGPGSKEVIDLIIQNKYYSVLGNHEDLMIEADGEKFDSRLVETTWSLNGGSVVVDSSDYNTSKDYLISYIKSLPRYLIFDDELDINDRCLLVTHAASIDFFENYEYHKSLQLSEKTDFEKVEIDHYISNCEELMLWNRNIPKKSSNKYFNVFGHTPIDSFIFDKNGDLKIKSKHLTSEKVVIHYKKGYANIDTGACYSYSKYRGKLTAMHFPSMTIIQQENIDV